MPMSCMVLRCKSKSYKDKVSFYHVPAVTNFKHKTEINNLKKLRREKWIKAFRRKDLNDKNVRSQRVCSKHFISGKPADLFDTNNPDWVPTLNMGYILDDDDSKQEKCDKLHTNEDLDNVSESLSKKQNMSIKEIKEENTVFPEHIENNETVGHEHSIEIIKVHVVEDTLVSEKDISTKSLKESNKPQEDINSLQCRICLTQSPSAVSLKEPLNRYKNDGKSGNVKICEALEQVMGVEIKVDAFYPTKICAMCLGLLNISYDLRCQFLNSKNYLEHHLSSNTDTNTAEGKSKAGLESIKNVEDELNIPKRNTEKDQNAHNTEDDENVPKRCVAPVELLVGKEKYDISQVVIIENDLKKIDNYNGFLNNLGKTVSAKIIKKNTEKKTLNIVEPQVMIEKISRFNSGDLKTGDEVYVDNLEDVDKYIIKKDEAILDTYGEKEYIKPQGLELVDHNIAGVNKDLATEQIQSELNLKYKCSYCGKWYCSKNRIMNHLTICRKIGRPNCTVCKKEFKTHKTLRAHLKFFHPEKYKSLRLKHESFKCDECNIVFKKRTSWMYHKTQHKGRNHTCEICGKAFYTEHMLANHLDVVHNKDSPKVLCQVCGKSFYHKSGLFYHMKVHTEERNYLCEYCDKKFYMLNCLKRHLRSHTGDRPYGCQFCKKMFFSSSEVKKHEYTHTGFKPHKCELCGKGFITAFNKMSHMQTHKGDIQCIFCNRTFINQEILKLHLKNKHKESLPLSNTTFINEKPRSVYRRSRQSKLNNHWSKEEEEENIREQDDTIEKYAEEEYATEEETKEKYTTEVYEEITEDEHLYPGADEEEVDELLQLVDGDEEGGEEQGEVVEMYIDSLEGVIIEPQVENVENSECESQWY